MVWTALALVGVAATLVYLGDHYAGDTAATVFDWAQTARMVVFGAFAVITALVFLSSGITGLMIIGFLVVLYIVAALYYEIDTRARLQELLS